MRLPVWDLPTRLFHWLLVASVGFCALSGYLLPEWWFGWHFISGYLLAGLLLFRLVWAFLGPEHSRWPGFTHKRSQIIHHIIALLKGQPPRHAGHNPAGGAMVLTLLLTLTALVVTGLVTLGGDLKQGPLAWLVSFKTGAEIKELHELIAAVILVLVPLHIGGVLLESRLTRENLTLAMITGDKEAPPGATAKPRRRFALLAFGGLLAVVGGGTAWLASLPVLGWQSLAFPPAYSKECGACHMAYHPSLLPAASWRGLMESLNQHFGEDAALSPALTAQLEDWLTANSAEAWDTQAANRLRQIDPAAPWTITKAPWWKRRHREVSEQTFQQKTIKNRDNCAACHQDAAQGRFDPQAIHIPSP